MERIKVIEYISNLGDGGAETLVKDYVRLLDRNRFEPVVVVLRGGINSANKRTIEENKIPIIEIFPHWNIFVRVWKKMFGRWYIPYRLRRIIAKENASVLHMHLMVLQHIPYIGKQLNALRLLFTCHSVPEAVFGGDRTKEKNAADYLVKYYGLQLIALHRDMADELNQLFGVENTAVVRNGIDFCKFRNLQISCAEERRALGIPENVFAIGHVGSFFKVKNHPFLVETFIEVAKRRDDAYLLMVGAGDSSAVEKQLRDNGLGDRYMILSHRTDVNEILRAMDVFVFPSLYEGLPLALIEAQVSGLRCIVSDAVPPEAFRSERVIALSLENPKKWADTILNDSVTGVSYGDLEDYDMNKEIKYLETLYLQ